MRKISTYLTILSMVLLASCQEKRSTTVNASPTPDNAALDLYYKYADNKNLTVAYLGDFTLDGNKIDALMLQSNDAEEWKQLKLDFGMAIKCDTLCCDSTSPSECPDGPKKVAVSIGIDTDFIEELKLDTITDPNQVGEERFNKMTEIIGHKIHDIIVNFEVADTIQPSDVIVDDGAVAMESETVSTDEYIHTISIAIANSLIVELVAANLASADSINSEPDKLAIDGANTTMKRAYSYGHNGYISAADDSTQTLWLFFYDDQEECNVILTHIKEDVLLGQPIANDQ